MAFPRSDVAPGAAPTATDAADGRTPQGSGVAPTVVKIVVAGGFAVGKTTFIGSISDIEPLSTEAAMTEHSVGIDDAGGDTPPQDHHHGRHGLRPHRAAGQPVALPVRYAGPGPLPVHVGRPGARRHRRRRPGRHRAAGPVLPGRRLLRGPGHPVRRGAELLRRRGPARHRRGARGAAGAGQRPDDLHRRPGPPGDQAGADLGRAAGDAAAHRCGAGRTPARA